MTSNSKAFRAVFGAVVGVVIGAGMQLQPLGLALAALFGAGLGLASVPPAAEHPVMKVSGLRWRRKRDRK